MSKTEQPEIIHVDITDDIPPKNRPDRKAVFRHSLLFVVTFISVAITSALLFVGHDAHAETLRELVFWEGIQFAFLLLLFLGTHEFGHYFAAVYHRVSASLPYFIPLPLISPIGTVGAVIRIKERIHDNIKLYDIGIAGPLAGFVVAMGVLLYGFATLPGPEYLGNFGGHEDMVTYAEEHGTFPDEPLAPEDTEIIYFGETLLYSFLASFFDQAPPMWEMYHYPFLLAGWLGLFFTALNLMPVGQLDGGHIMYTLIGFRKHQILARLFFGMVVTFAGFAVLPLLEMLSDRYIPGSISFGWLLWALLSFSVFRKAYFGHQIWTLAVWLVSLIVVTVTFFLAGPNFGSGFGVWVMFTLFILYFVKIEHPPVINERKLGPGRRILGWLTMLIFILCISPTPIYVM